MDKFLCVVVGCILVTALKSQAQNSILAGKIVDENQQPAHGALIKLCKSGVTIVATADSDGLYITRPLADGVYSIRVFYANNTSELKNIAVGDECYKGKFYELHIAGNQLKADINERDPFLTAKLYKLLVDKKRFDVPEGSFRVYSGDSSGNAN